MKKILILILCAGLFPNIQAQRFIAEGRYPLAVIPSETSGVEQAVTSLNGTWQINLYPEPEVWKTGSGSWKNIQVPGEPAMQGYKVLNDKEFFYRTTVNVPKDAKDKTVLIRFNGVYSYARVFVNGQLVREHFGGFTAWEADITDFTEPGQPLQIYVGVTDRADDISYASGYAHHSIGGILREVQLLIVPKDYLNRFYFQTDLTKDFKEATISFQVAKKQTENGSKIKLQLFDADQKPVFNQAQTFDLNDNGSGKNTITLKNPVLWNQEVPYLYTIKAELISNGTTAEVIEQKIGIRKVEVDGKRLLVNGDPVKLRGACRHDMHPLFGRSTSRYYDSLDVVLAREANVNFIRTSHYPPSRDFLEFADQLGLYVQEETAICFVNDWREGVYKNFGESYNDTAFTSRYLGQLSEMIDRDRNHPAVIMWSIGNESTYGINFQQEYDFVKSIDLTRPVSWTWPATALAENKKCFDIAVSHYPAYDGKDIENFGLKYDHMEHESMPLLSDEWAHVSCYNTTLLKADPNIKDFWGRSLDSMWSVRFDVPGNLGGAIWGMTDEIFHLPDTVTGYGPWGFIDVWRRKKTEFWNTKKAYSPVRVLTTEFASPGASQTILLPVKNRFNHLSLNAIRLKVTQGDRSGFQPLPQLKPHETGEIVVRVNDNERPLLLQFYDTADHLIDEELITWKESDAPLTQTSDRKWEVIQSATRVELKNKGLLIEIDAVTGQLVEATANGMAILTSGSRVIVNKPAQPDAFKETIGVYSGEYRVKEVKINTDDRSKVTVRSKGFVSEYPVIMTTTYFADGTIETRWEADSIPAYTWQIGIAIPVTRSADEIKWKRKGYWSTYPAGHLSASQGTAKRSSGISEHYRVKPSYGVAQGMNDYYLTGTITPENSRMSGSEGYRATKENVLAVDLFAGEKPILKLISNGQQASKINFPDSGAQELLVLEKWDYWSLSWGNYAGSRNVSGKAGGKVVLRIVTGDM